MNKCTSKQSNLDRTFLKVCLIIMSVVFIPASVPGEQRDVEHVEFSNHTIITEMPGEWRARSIEYEDWAKGADIAISLDQHFYEFFNPIIEAYAKEHDLNISVRNGTCGISSGLLGRKAVDIAGFCCPPGAADRLPGIKFHTLALTSLTILVHSGNPVKNITFDQARKIFQGEILNWAELKTADEKPGDDMIIQTYARLHCKLRPGHWCSLLSNENMFSPSLYEMGSIPNVIEKAAVNPQAIVGFESYYMTYHKYPQKNPPSFLTIDGYSPAKPDDLVSGRYPLYFVFNITSWEGENVENPHAKKLVGYLIDQAEQIDSKYNIIPVSRFRKAGWKFSGDELVGRPE